jgi:hypothetical protein
MSLKQIILSESTSKKLIDWSWTKMMLSGSIRNQRHSMGSSEIVKTYVSYNLFKFLLEKGLVEDGPQIKQ